MRPLRAYAVLTICGYVAADPQILKLPILNLPILKPVPRVLGVLAPALPLQSFITPQFARPISTQEALLGVNATVTTIQANLLAQLKKLMPELVLPSIASRPSRVRDVDAEVEHVEKRQSSCTNPRVRVEWDSYSDSDRQGFVDGIKCLMQKPPSGVFKSAQNLYEDLVAMHQASTPVVHGNAGFLLWHRYFLWSFEDILRRECGFNRTLPWFDEAKYAGRFATSSIFSSKWFGALNVGGNCVTDGQFAYTAINIGPGPKNVRHCLSRNGNELKTLNVRQALTDACNSRPYFADMASCAEGAAHAWGHNGIGAVMQDTYASPSDPVFWLHHAYVDRNFRKWQDSDWGTRITTVRGTDANGNQLTLDSILNLANIRPNARVRDILNTQSQTLCYKYSY